MSSNPCDGQRVAHARSLGHDGRTIPAKRVANIVNVWLRSYDWFAGLQAALDYVAIPFAIILILLPPHGDQLSRRPEDIVPAPCRSSG